MKKHFFNTKKKKNETKHGFVGGLIILGSLKIGIFSMVLA